MRLIIYLLTTVFLIGAVPAKAQSNAERKQMAERFLKDMYNLNKRYHNLGNASFEYQYSVYNDSLLNNADQSFSFSVRLSGNRSYYRYLNTEILNDSSFSMVRDHEMKSVNLLKKTGQAEVLNIRNMIDTGAFTNMLRQVVKIDAEKSGRVISYTIYFEEGAQLGSMMISFEDKGLLKEIVTKPQHYSDPELPSESDTRAMKITLKNYSNNKTEPGELDIKRYFRLFGNGKYVLSESYQTYKLNNLYEKPVY